MEDKLLKLLYDERILSAEQYEKVRQEQDASGESYDVLLERLNILGEAELLAFLGKKFRIPVVDWEAFSPDEELLTLLPEESARKYMVFPYLKEQGKRQAKLTLAVADPSDIRVNDDIAFMTGCTIKTGLASSRAIREAIQRYYAGPATVTEQVDAPLSAEGQASEDTLSPTGISAIDSLLSSIYLELQSEEDEQIDPLAAIDREHSSSKLLLDLLQLCAEQGLPEIHIEPCDSKYTVRLSQQGRLREHITISAPIAQGLVMTLRRTLQLPQKGLKPQSGALSTTLVVGKALQLQIHFYPGIAGDKIQIDLKNISELKTLEQLGIDETTLKALGRLIARPQGLLLLVSPPRQGKTTSLHALCHKLRQTEGHILSLESSIGRFLPQISQVPFSSQYSYQDWCSFISYQAPHILTLDHPTETDLRSRLALEFAPGSLVMMTVTAADAASGVCQVISGRVPQASDAGFSLLLDSINGVFSQRLLPTLCPYCKKEASLSQQDLALLKRLSSSPDSLENFTNFTAQGCAECHGTGYAGQTGIFEVIKFDKNLKHDLLQHQADCAHRIRQYCAETSQRSMKEQAFRLLRDGHSSLQEIRRALQR